MSPSQSLRDESASKDEPVEKPDVPPSQKRGLRFWLIMAALTVSGLLAAMESTVVSTALPSITAELGGGEKYIWVIMSYFLTMTALQPLFGQLADIFGRRWLIIIAVALFALGSGICGGADSMDMLIAGRAVQGFGAGGINVLVETIVCDIVPLRERGSYLAIVFGGITIGTAIGPVISGAIVERTTWRWVFYLNLPIAGLGLALLVAFLKVKQKKGPLGQQLARLDFIGNVAFIASSTSALIGIGWAGTVHPWQSVEVLVPLILGFLGLIATLIFEGFYEGKIVCREPLMPLHLFKNRTSSVVFVATFFHGVATIWVMYFLPVYFQSVDLSSPIRAGVQLLPTVLFMTAFAVVGGGMMEKTGKYKPIHIVGFSLMTIGFGILTLLDRGSSTAEWTVFQLIVSSGLGLIISTSLPAVQARLSDDDTAKATGVWQFLRSFGFVFGSAIPTAVFNSRFDEVSEVIRDAAVRAQLSGGRAYEHATQGFMLSLPTEVRDQVMVAFTDALKRTWQVGIAFAGVGVLLVLFEEQVELRKDLKGDFGIEKKESQGKDVETGSTRPTDAYN